MLTDDDKQRLTEQFGACDWQGYKGAVYYETDAGGTWRRVDPKTGEITYPVP